MTDSPKVPGNPGVQTGVVEVPSLGRRRLLQAGISAAPVVMTVISRPVLAQNGGNCQSPSGFESGNASSPDLPICTGLTPGYWKQEQWFGKWPSPYCPTTVTATNTRGYGTYVVKPATMFTDVFSPDLPTKNLSFLQVLDPNSSGAGPPYSVARHAVAAILNIAAGKVPKTVLDKARVQDIWKQYRMNGFYQVGTTSWNDEKIIAFLKTTMPL